MSAGPAAPIVDDRSVRVAGQAAYRSGGSEELVFEIELLTEFRDGMIVGLADLYPVAERRPHARLDWSGTARASIRPTCRDLSARHAHAWNRESYASAIDARNG